MRNLNFFPRLALVNLVRNGRFYGPFLFSGGSVAAMYYILRFLSGNEGLKDVRGAMYLLSLMGIGCFVVSLFSAVILLYANSFVMKRRQRELGLYNILGLEKRHIAVMCFWETLYCALISIIGGVLAGILFSKAVLLLLLQLSHMPVQFGFSVSFPAIGDTVTLMGGLFLLTLASNLLRVTRSRPVELLHAGGTGEREPRTKVLMTLLGLLTLGGGYYLAFKTENPVEAMMLFLVAVGLVMMGTYCLFTAGSIFLLKRLRANKGFYYQTRHFTAVSGLLYRMKQNAVGLANICILSTMVLVTVSTTISLYFGLENALNEMCPYDFEAVYDLDRDPGDVQSHLERVRRDVEESPAKVASLSWYSRYWVYCGVRDGELALNLTPDCTRTELEVITAADYTRLTDREVILAPGEALAYVRNLEDLPRDLTVSAHFGEKGYSVHIREYLPEFIRRNDTTLLSYEEPFLGLVVADEETAASFMELNTRVSAHQFRIQLQLEGTEQEKLEASEYLLAKSNGDYGINSKQDMAVDYYAMYGGFLFLGVFLGLLFLLVTVLIIYYKQISEGYEDQRRYQIMRQVGMTDREVSASIHSQILLVFFLPLGAAGIHVLAAFPMLSRMLLLFNLHDIRLFAVCSVGTLLVFCVIYGVVYGLTARTYDRIVGG